MIINDLDGYYIVFDIKNWNTELDTLPFCPTTLNLFLSCLFCSSITDSFKTPINISFNPFCCVQVNRRGVAFRLACVLLLNIHP